MCNHQDRTELVFSIKYEIQVQKSLPKEKQSTKMYCCGCGYDTLKIAIILSVVIVGVTGTTGTVCVSEISGEIGSCLPSSKCTSEGGIQGGTCGNKKDVCCVLIVSTCNSIIKQNLTSYRNPNGVSGYRPYGRHSCSLGIQKPSKHICQVRLDFLRMELAGANESGHCLIDEFIVNGPVPPIRNLCGKLSGQHLYIEFGKSPRLVLIITTNNTGSLLNSAARFWDILVTYIPCNSVSRAPEGCLQYFSGSTGEVRILGYPMVPHLANLDYTVCVRGDDNNVHSIVWRPCPDEPVLTGFLMSGLPPANTSVLNSPLLCPNDFIMIMTDEELPVTKANDRYCGSALSRPGLSDPSSQVVRSTSRPFILRVKTDGEEIDGVDNGNTGFCLVYRQEILKK